MVKTAINQTVGKKITRKMVEEIVKFCADFFKKKEGEISVALVDEEEMKKLNNRYRGKNYPTDVLSFLYEENPWEGEVIICYPVARKQAREQRCSWREEFKRLLVHGLVHLAGYDHRDTRDAQKMRKVEQRVLNSLN